MPRDSAQSPAMSCPLCVAVTRSVPKILLCEFCDFFNKTDDVMTFPNDKFLAGERVGSKSSTTTGKDPVLVIVSKRHVLILVV